jgi:hypothetical protein
MIYLKLFLIFLSNNMVKHLALNQKKSLWFDSNCKHAKHSFYCDKRAFKAVPSDDIKARFLHSRKHYTNTKRKARRIFQY